MSKLEDYIKTAFVPHLENIINIVIDDLLGSIISTVVSLQQPGMTTEQLELAVIAKIKSSISQDVETVAETALQNV